MRHLLLCVVFSSSIRLSAQTLGELEKQARDAYNRKDYARSAELSRKYYDALNLELQGSKNYKLALAAMNSAKALQMAGSKTEAVQYADIACRISSDIESEPSARTGQCLVFAVELKAQAGQIKEAAATATQALAIISKTMPPLGAAAGCFHLGELFRDAHADAEAASYFAEAARRYDKDALNNPDFLAAALNERAMSLSRQHLLAEACKEMERAIAIGRSTGSSTTASAISKTFQLADWYRDLGEFDKSIEALQLVAEALKKAPDSGHIARADILLQIAERLNQSGGSSEALAMLREVIASPDKGEQNSPLLRRLAAHRLSGEISYGLHDYGVAEQQYRSALALTTGLPAAEAATRASTVGALGFYFLKRGRYTEARASLDEALSIYERTSDLDGVATTLETIVLALVNSNDCESALPLLQRATQIRQEIGPKSEGMIRVLKLSIRCASEDAKEDLFEKTFQLQQEVEGGVSLPLLVEIAQEMERRGDLPAAKKAIEFAVRQSPGGGVVLDVLASVREKSGDFKGAIEARRAAVAVAEEHFGSDSVNFAARRFNLAGTLLRSGDVPEARSSFVAAARAFGAHADRQLKGLSLGEQRQLILGQAAVQTGGLLSVSQAPDHLTEAYGLILPWKGLLLEGQRRESLLTRAMSGSQDQENVARWKTLRSELAAWSSTRSNRPESEWKPVADRLTREKEAVERLLLRGAAVSDSPEVSIATIQGALRNDEVLVDIYKFELFSKAEKTTAQYGAVILGHSGPPTFVSLGEATRIEGALSRWLAGLAENAPGNWSRLESLVWKRIQTALPSQTHRVRVSPDGELVRIPWHQFGASDAQSAREVTEVDSPRAFVALRDRPSKTDSTLKLLLIGDLDFEAGRTPKNPGTAGKPFPVLRWTAMESKAIIQIAAKNSVELKWLKRAEATKSEVLSSLPHSLFIHFATHGFTNGESEWGLGNRSWVVGPTKRYPRDPLIDAGLALSGANVRDPVTLESSGVLTAEELLDLDLSATGLLVLSACNTGLGLATPAQGVTGLRSAIVAAGARNLLISLWSVDDEATQILMERFYSALWQEKRSMVKALHEAQSTVKSDARFKAPKYWAGWVIVSVE